MRTDVKSVNRYGSSARGVIVMRLNEGDEVAGIAVFRAENRDDNPVTDEDSMPDNGDPSGGSNAVTAFGSRAMNPYTSDQFDLYTGNANTELARKIAQLPRP